MKKAEFMKIASQAASTNDDAADPLEFIRAERNEKGAWEAFYQDASTVYYIGEDGCFNYAGAR